MPDPSIDYETLARQLGGRRISDASQLATSRGPAQIDYEGLARKLGGQQVNDPMQALSKARSIAPNLPKQQAHEFAEAHPVLQGIADLVTGGATSPDFESGPADLVMAALPVGKLAAEGGNLLKGIKAYHGSAKDFEKFSLEHIGTGEGATAYGHGLYFAESPGTARFYRDKLGRLSGVHEPEKLAKYYMPGNIVPGYAGTDRVLQFKADTQRGGWAVQVQRVVKQGNEWIANEPPRWHATSPSADEYTRVTGEPLGRMYEINIHADPAEFLDWDKSLSQQSPQVQQALAKAGVTPDPSLFNKLPPGWDEPGHRLYQAAARQKGGTRTLATQVQGGYPVPFTDEAAASQMLREAGIPGIKYLDRSSRAVGEGTRNYVIFDDSLVSILKKYGVALPMIDFLRRRAKATGALPADIIHGLLGATTPQESAEVAKQ